GALGQFLASPTDLVKIQMQMEGRRRLEGKPPRVRGSWHAFTKILHEGGIRGLWKGWSPNIQRAFLINAADLATYDTSKQLLVQYTRLTSDNTFTHFISSALSGITSALAAAPSDVLKTRIMNQPTDKNGRGLLYKSSLDCLLKTVRNEGFLALYKGFLPSYARLAPWYLIFWTTYEKVRYFAGATAF
ncbi:unnamed protein product, partial [Owenia fusiformis]